MGGGGGAPLSPSFGLPAGEEGPGEDGPQHRAEVEDRPQLHAVKHPAPDPGDDEGRGRGHAEEGQPPGLLPVQFPSVHRPPQQLGPHRKAADHGHGEDGPALPPAAKEEAADGGEKGLQRQGEAGAHDEVGDHQKGEEGGDDDLIAGGEPPQDAALGVAAPKEDAPQQEDTEAALPEVPRPRFDPLHSIRSFIFFRFSCVCPRRPRGRGRAFLGGAKGRGDAALPLPLRPPPPPPLCGGAAGGNNKSRSLSIYMRGRGST